MRWTRYNLNYEQTHGGEVFEAPLLGTTVDCQDFFGFLPVMNERENDE